MTVERSTLGPLGRVLPSMWEMVGRLPGMVRTTVRYLRQTRPAMEHEVVDCDFPAPPLGGGPSDPAGAPLLTAASGWGPTYRRVYRVEIDDPRIGAEELIDHLVVDPNRVSPTEVVTFRPRGRQRRAPKKADRQVGSEFEVDMPGPWDACVRVVDRGPRSFRLATLQGHMEAGEIEFRADDAPGGRLVFEIESVARSADRLMHLLYDRLRISREMQMHMWVAVCLRAVELTGGTPRGDVHVTTYRHSAA